MKKNKEETIKSNLKWYMRVFIVLTCLYAWEVINLAINKNSYSADVSKIYDIIDIKFSYHILFNIFTFFQIIFLFPFVYHIIRKRLNLYKPFFISYGICFIIGTVSSVFLFLILNSL